MNTLDFVIKDEESMMSLLVVISRLVYGIDRDTSYREIYSKLKFKMKLSYQCWQQKQDLRELVCSAIQKTLDESLKLATKELQDFLQNKDGVPFLSYSEKSFDEDRSLQNNQAPNNDLQHVTALAIVQLNTGKLDDNSLPSFISSSCAKLTAPKQLAFSHAIYNYWYAKDDLTQQKKFYRMMEINR